MENMKKTDVMHDKAKIIKGLEVIKQFFEYGLPSTAEMFDSYYGILNDAQKLLKEQDQQIENLEYALAITENNLNYYVNGND